jgi:hypothetical protein
VVCPRAGGDLLELGWDGELRASGGAFIGARGRMAAWARAAGKGATRGKTGGAAASLLMARLAVAPAAPAIGKCHLVEAS